MLEVTRLEDNFNRMISEAVATKKETPTESVMSLAKFYANRVGSIKMQYNRKIILHFYIIKKGIRLNFAHISDFIFVPIRR